MANCLLRKISLPFILILSGFTCFSQNNSYPYSGDIIKVDSLGRTDKGVPFDKPFVIERDKINTANIQSIELYSVKYLKGVRELIPDRNKKTHYTPDYIFPERDIIKEKNKLTLNVPPLKPNRDFDIVVVRKGVSGNNYKSLTALNKILIKGPLTFRTNSDGSQTLLPDAKLAKMFSELKQAANDSANYPDREFFPVNLNTFYRTVTVPVSVPYKLGTDDSKLKKIGFLTEPQITGIKNGAARLQHGFRDVYLLEQIHVQGNFERILYGYIPVTPSFSDSGAEPDAFDTRIENLASSAKYFDSLYASLNEMVIADNALYAPIRAHVRKVLEIIDYNKNFLSDKVKQINQVIEDHTSEATWLTVNTIAKDLQTKGASIFTVDVGIANIWARDLDNKNVYIPKLYYGVNIYFRPIDKTVKSRYMPGKRKPTLQETFDILSRKTIARRLSFTAGFTIGSLDKNNFDNFFGGSSLLLGPGYLITDAFRISTGVSFLKRSTLNPLVTEKKITAGYYITASLDFDLLGTLVKVTGLLLK